MTTLSNWIESIVYQVNRFSNKIVYLANNPHGGGPFGLLLGSSQNKTAIRVMLILEMNL